MNKFFILLLLTLLVDVSLYAQQPNPYQAIGKKAKVLTAYGGRFDEFFDYDTIQRVGSVLINIRTKKIVKLLSADKVFTSFSDNSSTSRWYSVDPKADKFTGWSPYNFVENNPIAKVDKDGKASEWIPQVQQTKDKNGNVNSAHLVLQKEKGDNAQSLAKFLNVSQKEANTLYSKMSPSGTVTPTNDIPGVAPINAAAKDAVVNSGNYSHNAFTTNKILGSTNYNCFQCALAVSSNETPNFGTVTSSSSFKSEIDENYKNVSPDQAKFGKTIVAFGDVLDLGTNVDVEHAAVFLGQSHDGTIYLFSKDGRFYPPAISTLSSLKKEYDNVMGTDGTIGKGYYNPK